MQPQHHIKDQRAGADPHALRQLLRHAGQAGGAAQHAGRHIGIGQRVDAGHLQRTEEAARQQRQKDHHMRRHRLEKANSENRKALHTAVLAISTARNPKVRMIGPTVTFIVIAPAALAKVSSPEDSGVEAEPDLQHQRHQERERADPHAEQEAAHRRRAHRSGCASARDR